MYIVFPNKILYHQRICLFGIGSNILKKKSVLYKINTEKHKTKATKFCIVSKENKGALLIRL